MALLDRDAILGANDLPTEDVEVPEWGGTVRVRGLTAIERDRWELAMSAAVKAPQKADIRASMVAKCIVDEDGKSIFTDADVKALGRKSGAALDRVFDAVRRLSGLGNDAVQSRVEDFGDAPSDGSPSA